MKEMTLVEIRECTLGILDYIDRICKANSLQYFLCGGTLLGALRHKGFIPWDDDIDIMMPRKDYEMLSKVWPDDSCYKFLNHSNTHNFPFAYGKAINSRTLKIEPYRKDCQLIGVDVDIFPIDNIPEDSREARVFFKKIAKLQSITNLQIAEFSKSKSFLHRFYYNYRVGYRRTIELLGFSSVDKVVNDFSSFAQRYNDKETPFCGITAISHYGVKEKNPKKNYLSTIEVPFEGKMYPAPIGYDEYLSQLYGHEYMQLPPMEMRQTHHSYKAFWK